jgi:hypothetical protein
MELLLYVPPFLIGVYLAVQATERFVLSGSRGQQCAFLHTDEVDEVMGKRAKRLCRFLPTPFQTCCTL